MLQLLQSSRLLDGIPGSFVLVGFGVILLIILALVALIILLVRFLNKRKKERKQTNA
jgi:flagellar biogenesis protein FliO